LSTAFPENSADRCELCTSPGGELLHQAAQFRVVLVDDENYPGFCRVIWSAHVKEVTDLPELDRMLLMDVLWQVEQVVRDVMQPEKINLASFGNMVPHLHWSGGRLSARLRPRHCKSGASESMDCVPKCSKSWLLIPDGYAALSTILDPGLRRADDLGSVAR
jgi:hypothetical protein